MSKYMHDLRILNFSSEIDLNVLWDKIQRFRNLNKKNLSIEQLRNEIFKVIAFNNKSLLQVSGKVFKSDTLMYRVRKLQDNSIPNNDMKVTSDAWNPPSDIVKMGRLNKERESLLYICPDAITAIEETKVKENETFALMVYEVIDDIKACGIGLNSEYSSFTGENKLKIRLIHDFLREEFSRDVGEGTEHLYRISEIIAKDYFDLPPRDVQDAWGYPSIANKPSINICLRPEIAFDKLSLKGIQIVTSYSRNDDDIQMVIKAVAKDNENGQIEYFKIGSEQQIIIFPEISKI